MKMAKKLLACLLLLTFLLPATAAMGGYATLKMGDKGDAVMRMQQALSDLGYTLKVDGVYSRGTQSAVKAFQRDQGLKEDGKAGDKTLSRLYGTEPAAGPTPELTTSAPTAASTPPPTSATVSTPSGPLNMRKAASGSARIMTKIPDKATVAVLSYEGEWAKVTYKSYTGYVKRSFLTSGGAQEASARLYPGLPITPVRIGPSEDAEIIDQMNSNSVFTILSRGKEWTKIKFGEDEIGYVLTSSLKPETQEETEASPSRYSFTYAVLKSDQPVYREALDSAAIVGSVEKGEPVEVLYVIGGWGNVSDGTIQGWVKSGALDFDNVDKNSAANAVMNAEASAPGLYGMPTRGTPAPRKSYDGMEEISKEKAASIGASALADKFGAFKGPSAYTVEASYHDNEPTQFEQPYWQFNYVASKEGYPQLTAVKFIVMVHTFTQKVIYIVQGAESDLTEISYATPTPAPVYGEEEKANPLSKSDALSIGKKALAGKYSDFDPSAYTVSVQYAEIGSGFEPPYWQIDFLNDRGGSEYAVYVHAYTRKILYTCAPGGGHG